MHLFNAETFSQKMSRKLPNCQENVCIACQSNASGVGGGLYAVGCRSYTLLLDPRTLQAVKKSKNLKFFRPQNLFKLPINFQLHRVIMDVAFDRRAFRKIY